MRVLVVGAGRMGQRHLVGLSQLGLELHVVDPRVDEVPGATVHADFPALDFDAAVLAETAAGRLERVRRVVDLGVPRILVEKPLEQSRSRTRELVAALAGVDASCDLPLRTVPFLADLRPLDLAVTGGAFGLAGNGLHWIDLARALAGGGGELLWGELDETPIASGRGEGFRDYGGRGVFGFAGGLRLYLASLAASPAPMSVTATGPDGQALLDLTTDAAIRYRRDPASEQPAFRYGADHERELLEGALGLDLTQVAVRWLEGCSALPAVAEAAVAHELLFDLIGDDPGGIT